MGGGARAPPAPPPGYATVYARIRDLQQRRHDIITVQRIFKIMTPALDYWRQLDRLNAHFLPMRAKRSSAKVPSKRSDSPFLQPIQLSNNCK